MSQASEKFAKNFLKVCGPPPTWLEYPAVVETLSQLLPAPEDNAAAPRKKSGLGAALVKNLLDVGIISSASLFLGVWSLGILPLTVFAAAGLAGVLALRAYQATMMRPGQTAEELNKKGALSRFFNRPAAAYTLSSLSGLGVGLLALGAAATGLGAGVSLVKFASMAVFSLVFSASNNMKAARLDHDRGYDVQALPGLRRLNPSWSEKLSVVGNIARTFMAGPVVGLLTLPLMRQALKFSARDKDFESASGVSYTEKYINPLYGWKNPHSDSGMARRMTGLANVFSAAAALVAGDPKVAASLAYPAVAQLVLGQQADEAYAMRRGKAPGPRGMSH